nr:TetR/AcrR family transcriptional regulator C-terminal domain-containing protein [Streptomyces antimycoticus]
MWRTSISTSKPRCRVAAAASSPMLPPESRHRRLLYRSRDAAAFPLLVQHADTLAEVSSDDEFEVGLNALLTGFRTLIQNSDLTRD